MTGRRRRAGLEQQRVRGSAMLDVFDAFSAAYARERHEETSLQAYLMACRDDPKLYASAPERLIKAIGEPEIFDKSNDSRLGRIFMNRTIKRYPEFAEFRSEEHTSEPQPLMRITYAALC